jgi:hypothetical protein
MRSVGIPEQITVNLCKTVRFRDNDPYVITCDMVALVFKDHDLIPRISADFSIFPVVNRYLRGLRTIIARHVKDATSRHKLRAALSLLADARGVVNVRI